MLNELDKKILLTIIDSNSYVNSSFLSSSCNASISTIRQEIDIINNFLLNHKCHIEAKTSLGYAIFLDDKEIAKKFIINFQKDARRFIYMNSSNLSSAYFIIRKLLTSNAIISIENISDEIYKSKSTTLRILDNVKEILSKYNLELVSKRNFGLIIEGDEWDKRMCLINQHKIYTHTPTNVMNESSFETSFFTRTMFENALNSVLSNAMISFPFYKTAAINFSKLRNLILLNLSRSQYTKNLRLSHDKNLVHTEEFELATFIYKSLPKIFHDDNLDINILLLTSFLIVSRSYTNISEIKKDFHKYKAFTEKLIVFISTYHDIQYCFETKFIENFSCYLKSLDNHLKYRVPYDAEALASSLKNGLFTNDLCALFGLFYYQNTGIYLEETDLINAYSIINRTISGNILSSDKKRILIYSRYGIDHARNVEQKIKSRYYNYISDIRPIEFSELLSMNLSGIDIIATDDSSAMNFYMNLKKMPETIKIVNFSFFRVENDFYNINKFFLENNLNVATQMFKEENFHKIEVNSQNDVIKYIYNLYKDELGDFEHFNKDIQLRNHFINPEKDNGLVLLAPLAFKLSKTVYDVIIPNKSFVWNNNKVNIVIFYQIGHGSRSNQNSINYLTFNFMHNSKSFASILKNLTYDEVVAKFKNIEEIKSNSPTL
jgi:hypothetical protein